ncbi:sensor histidine kinase [Vagococcus elongatus]|uniref:Histidine kinase domain-containing protein n=1 Tax=Vagococcus elongatus TaxID=180344 RepID=A0A430B4Q1_9ENTE|nr:histidine kinase N-terminal domain-containing protein [Vagococcus elongatus]RSU15231.1 hypothetical protein CBF29_02545 [Vagococcus elongatus]
MSEVNEKAIFSICQTHTRLSERDIQEIIDVASTIQHIADLTNADVCVDCLTREVDTAVVVAHAKPAAAPSIYHKEIVGELAHRKKEPGTLRTIELGLASKGLRAMTQEGVWVQQNAVPIINNQHQSIGAIVIETPTRENTVEPREALPKSFVEDFMKAEQNLGQYLNDAVIIFDEDQKINYVNKAAQKLYEALGYKEKLTSLTFINISLGNYSFSALEKLSLKKKPLDQKNPLVVEEIEISDRVLLLRYFYFSGSLIMFIIDKTELKTKEKELIEKTVALKEVNHRIKNNMQIVASYLNIQSRKINDTTAKEIFMEAVNQILSMASTYDFLSANNFEEVDITAFLRHLFKKLQYDLIHNVELQIEGESVMMQSEKVSIIGMAVNELVTNSLKYAFEEKGETSGCGNTVVIQVVKKQYTYITVYDNGNGFSYQPDDESLSGLELTRRLVEDNLNGLLEVSSNSKGTEAVIII